MSAARATGRWLSGERVWLHVLLLLLTFLTTTAFGSALAASFHSGLPLSGSGVFAAYGQLFRLDRSIWSGLSFSGPLLAILLSHEAGHYVACRYWRVGASLPYFLPSPTLLGTFGAFIRIRSPIYTRRMLFDIGACGPFAGFVVLLPILVAGVWKSHILAHPAFGDLQFSTPIVLRLVEMLRFGHLPATLIQLHPMAVAGWAGLLATAINLLPMGQLDGGHILYSTLGENGHRTASTAAVALLVVLGFQYWAWWAWAVVMFFFGRRHPLVYDATPLNAGRRFLSVVALILLIVCFSVVPVATR